MNTGIYEIVNTTNGDRYIGGTIHLNRRWSCHRSQLRGNYHTGKLLQDAWNEYGENAFEYRILLYCDESMLDWWEDRCLASLQSNYNISKTHWGWAGNPLSEEAKKRIGDAHRGKPLSEEHKRKLSAAKAGKIGSRLGSHVSEETKQKLRELRLKQVFSEDVIERRSESIRNTYRSGNHSQAKLSMDKAKEIRRRVAQGELIISLAKEYGVDRCTISRVVNDTAWMESSYAN